MLPNSGSEGGESTGQTGLQKRKIIVVSDRVPVPAIGAGSPVPANVLALLLGGKLVHLNQFTIPTRTELPKACFFQKVASHSRRNDRSNSLPWLRERVEQKAVW